MAKHSGCSFDGCDRKHKGHGLCAGHLWQSKNKDSLTELEVRLGGNCSVDDCDNSLVARGMCVKHYKKAEYHGEFTDAICSILSCKNKVSGRGYCQRHNQLSKKYNLTAEAYEEILESQGSKCAICSRVNSMNKRTGSLFIDHDHATGEVRGLLCHWCNAGIGYFKDDINLLDNAIDYLGR